MRVDQLKNWTFYPMQLSKNNVFLSAFTEKTHKKPSWPKWAQEELNFRPHAYQACALTT